MERCQSKAEELLHKRPGNLPDFEDPPLNEVVLGVQFSPLKEYQQIRAGEVWGLFKSEYPNVQELQPLEPVFETFGLPHQSTFGDMRLIPGPWHNRYWFLRSTRDELIQFQPDRLIHNWRKVGDQTNEYSRFERMLDRFSAELHKLEEFAGTLTPQELLVNQCEVTYVNHIPEREGRLHFASWFRGLSLDGIEAEDVNAVLREVLLGSDGKPLGRIIIEIKSGIKPSDKRIIVFNITVRGAPNSPRIESALSFIERAREIIVHRFAEVTTSEAHVVWGRKA